MGKGEFVVINKEHYCDLPSQFSMRTAQYLLKQAPFGNGTVWKCECGQHWEYEYSRYYPDRIPWLRISPRAARKKMKKNGLV